SPTVSSVHTTSTPNHFPNGVCVDNVGGTLSCAQLPGVCDIPQTTFKPSPYGCMDHMLGDVECAQIPGVCSDTFGHIICEKTCTNC
ncbi:hypothetical protein BaRGS_00036193, partial [Batillaria attramentaria]